jgi:hypothetical protein
MPKTPAPKKPTKKLVVPTDEQLGHRRSEATIKFIVSLADEGNEKAAEFLNKLWAGAFDFDEPK